MAAGGEKGLRAFLLDRLAHLSPEATFCSWKQVGFMKVRTLQTVFDIGKLVIKIPVS